MIDQATVIYNVHNLFHHTNAARVLGKHFYTGVFVEISIKTDKEYLFTYWQWVYWKQITIQWGLTSIEVGVNKEFT